MDYSLGYDDCECTDPGCEGHPGIPGCDSRNDLSALLRVDYDDECPVIFCSDCAADALDTGLFTTLCK